jgi:hypothetical protein
MTPDQPKAVQNNDSANLNRFLEETDPECVCCPMADVCAIDPGIIVRITRDMIKRSNCGGSFVDAFEDVHP